MSDSGAILVVEDDESLRQVIVELLRREGYAVAEASNGREALEQLPRTRPLAVILDVMMPVMDGTTFLEHKLSDPAVAHVPVVIFSSHPPPDIHRKPGVVSVIKKPDGLDELLETLRNMNAPLAAS